MSVTEDAVINDAGLEAVRELIDQAEPMSFEDLQQELAGQFDVKVPDIDKMLCDLSKNDSGNAQRLIARFGEDLIHIHENGWLTWNGKCWEDDRGDMRAMDYAMKTAYHIYGEVRAAYAAGISLTDDLKEFKKKIGGFFKFASDSGNAFRIRSMLSLAASQQRKTYHDLDAQKYIFNVENGALHLDGHLHQKGVDPVSLKAHSRADFLTKVSPVKYVAGAGAPNFRKFLDDILPDIEIQNFLQRWFGYCLTGLNTEQFIVMFYGGGANGKSTIMDLINEIMGAYSSVLPFASLLRDDRKRGSEATPDIARLPGVRYVTAAEPDQGARFSESILKSLTGGEKMVVRHLNKDFFEFYPQFKLVLAFNNKPDIRGQDHGIWRRILLVPFEQTFVDPDKLEEMPHAKPKDPHLKDKLVEELPGILNWMLDGYRLWTERGLDIPDVVRAATNEYQTESNQLLTFIRDWTRTGGGDTQAKELYNAYELWCRLNAEKPWTQTTFGKNLSSMGHKKGKGRGGLIYYEGLSLTEEAQSEIFNSTKPFSKKDEDDD